MPRPALTFAQRLRSRSPRSAGLVITVVLALAGASAPGALRAVCDHCPRTCPMHQHGDRAAPAAAGRHVFCHSAPTSAASGRYGAPHERGPTVRCATCGSQDVLPAHVLPPMILPGSQPQRIAVVVHPVHGSQARRDGRLADPPDTPPPIARA